MKMLGYNAILEFKISKAMEQQALRQSEHHCNKRPGPFDHHCI